MAVIRKLSLLTVIAFLCVCLTAFAEEKKEQAGPNDNKPPEGFTALFNGKDLTHWKGLTPGANENPIERAKLTPEKREAAQKEADESMKQHWKVEDGVLVYDGKGHSLATAKNYADFEMYVDWKIEKNGDSGIYIRGTPQVQIWDPASGPAGGTGSGGLYNNQKNPSKPTEVADKPIGEWNTFWIKMVDEKVWVKLNGKMVVDGVILENFWDRSKPIFPSEQIELQHHGSTLYFKNIYIKELEAEKK